MRLSSYSEQVAHHIIAGLKEKRWEGQLPGILKLSDELEVNHNTVVSALKILEERGFIRSTGPGKPRMITVEAEQEKRGYHHIKILPFEPSERYHGLVYAAYQSLQAAGYDVSYTPKSLCEINFSEKLVANKCNRYQDHAWLVVSGTEGILQQFLERNLPVLSFFGFSSSLPVAKVGADMSEAVAEATRRLITLGHDRVVFLCWDNYAACEESKALQAFLDTMNQSGVRTGSYNVGNCGTSYETLENCLHASFQFTPPTALIVADELMLRRVELFLVGRGLRVPEDISIVLLDQDRLAYWRETKLANCSWPSHDVNKAVLKWAGCVASGQSYVKQHLLKASFVESDSIGTATSLKKARTAHSR